MIEESQTGRTSMPQAATVSIDAKKAAAGLTVLKPCAECSEDSDQEMVIESGPRAGRYPVCDLRCATLFAGNADYDRAAMIIRHGA